MNQHFRGSLLITCLLFALALAMNATALERAGQLENTLIFITSAAPAEAFDTGSPR
jgi:hypothetical protein